VPSPERTHARVRPCIAVLAGVLITVLVCASPALAGPWWRLSARAAPTYLAPGKTGLIDVAADDIGDAGVTGATHEVTLEDVLPSGLRVSEASAINPHRARAGNRGSAEERARWNCSVTEERQVACSTALAIPPYELFELEIPVQVDEPAGTVTALPNQASITGGEAEAGGTVGGVSITRPVQISDEPVPFGIEEHGYSITPENNNGSLDTQAGSHPFQLTSILDFDQTLEEVQEPGQKPLVEPAALGLPKDLSFSLPPGLLGNITAVEQCSELDFSALKSEGNSCPAASAVGVATVTVLEPSRADYITKAVPLFNLEPERGEPARFGFEAVRVPVLLNATVRTGGDYGVTVSVNNATEAAQVLAAQITFWGEPDNQSHDNSRSWACLRGGVEAYEDETCEPPKSRSTVPLLTLPTSCIGALSTSMAGESWSGYRLEGQYTLENSLGETLAGLEGCSTLPFEPSINLQPEQQPEEGRPQERTSAASTPTGLNANVEVAQEGTLTEGHAADADVKSATVTLPPGMLLNPSAANGLEACTEGQIGYLGQGSNDALSPGTTEPLRFSTEKAACPEASKIATVHIKTPLLSEELQGWVYLANPAPNGETGQNPFNSLVAMYILAENETLGLRVKLAGEVKLNEQTGQLTTTFQNTPQVPFEALKLQFFGGPRGSLSTPSWCGSYTAKSIFAAWSGASKQPQSEPPFQITSGPDGEPCPSDPLPFAPSFQAGSSDNQAGAFTPFVLNLARPDEDQAFDGITVRLPAGIAALLSKLTPCPEPPAGQEWTCGSESLVGHANESSGLGGEPYKLTGQVYITTGYDGAPFGLLVRTLAEAGPFNLGYVDVRSRINVEPHTAQVTITSDPGPRDEAIPTMLKGIPVQLKRLEVIVDRPEFQFNPTNCALTAITGTLSGSEGASQNVSSPFQVSGCQNLPFKPGVTAATQGKTSKADGASLKLTFKSKTGEADVAKTILTIPAILPARLTTIQKACIAAVFEANPAACPEGSDIGSAAVHTPVLKNPVTGPIYLVSHGNAAWPDAELVLQGEGITVILDGQTAIKKGVTTSSFLTVPDVPFESVEATLPEGAHSALTTNLPAKDEYNLCGQHLSIPTALTGQNSTAVNENVKVNVQGCTAVRAAKTFKLSRAQQLTNALRACRKDHRHSHSKLAACERAARRKYTRR
jgi:hypothetical protein